MINIRGTKAEPCVTPLKTSHVESYDMDIICGQNSEMIEGKTAV